MFSWRYLPRQKLHSSVFIAFVSAGLVIGVMISPIATLELTGFSWLAVALLLLGGCFLWQRTWLVGVAVIAGFLLGLWRGDMQLVKIEGYKPYFSHTVRLTGTIVEDIVEGKHGDKQVEVGNIQINGRQLPEKVWLSLRAKGELKRSDIIVIEGKLKTGFGSFAASMGYAKIISHEKEADEARDVRDWFASNVRKNISEPEASLGLGFLVGQRSSLPPELDQQLMVVGLTHIVVASGYNLTILVRLARRLLTRVSKYLTAATSSFMIGGFILVTGLSPSMSRAGLVAGLSLAAWYYGRKINPFVLLPVVSAMTLLANPSFAWGDIGWALSFVAFGGVMIVAPLMQHYFFGERKPHFIRQIFGESIAALIATAPIIMLVFGQYSVYGLLSNLLVVPLIPIIMLAVFIAGIASIVVPSIATFANVPATILLEYVTSIVRWVANLPNAQTELTINISGLILCYLALVVVASYMWFKTKHDFREDNIIE